MSAAGASREATAALDAIGAALDGVYLTDEEVAAVGVMWRLLRRRSYVCPQCGPDPRGSEVHAEARHTAAGLLGGDKADHQDASKAGEQ